MQQASLLLELQCQLLQMKKLQELCRLKDLGKSGATVCLDNVDTMPMNPPETLDGEEIKTLEARLGVTGVILYMHVYMLSFWLASLNLINKGICSSSFLQAGKSQTQTKKQKPFGPIHFGLFFVFAISRVY